MSLTDEMARTRRTREIVEGLIADPRRLGPDFQPIRRLADRALVGHKATGRGEPGTELGDVLSLLHGAQSLGLVERLDWAFRCLALETALAARLTVELHLTPEPETFGSPCPPRLAVAFARGRSEVAVVAELHPDAFDDRARLRAACDEFRSYGWQFAVTDVADYPAALAELEHIRPAYVQVDLMLPGRRGGAGAVRELTDAAVEAGATLMAIGIDSEADQEQARALGATVGRGLLLGAPGPLR